MKTQKPHSQERREALERSRQDVKRECLNCEAKFNPKDGATGTWADAFCSRRCEDDYYRED